VKGRRRRSSRHRFRCPAGPRHCAKTAAPRPTVFPEYQLHFGGSTTGIGAYKGQMFSQDITYNITVQAVPEPSGVALLGLGALALLPYGWRWRRSRSSAGIA
jgi:PEP-CTERM motif